MIRFLEILVEFISWLKIVAAPFLFSILLGGAFYLYKSDPTGAFIGGLTVAIGLIVGIVLATRISKKVGAAEFNARLMASPDFDELAKMDRDGKKGE